MHASEGASQRVLRFRNQYQVDVIGHQAVTEDVHTRQPRIADQEVEIETVVAGREEDRLAVVTALGDVMRHVGDHDTRTPGHIMQWRRLEGILK
jgi:hypothetical protein